MRKSKEIKRKRMNAATEFRRGNRTEAYKLWAEAKKDRDALRGKAASIPAPGEAPPAEPAAS